MFFQRTHGFIVILYVFILSTWGRLQGPRYGAPMAPRGSLSAPCLTALGPRWPGSARGFGAAGWLRLSARLSARLRFRLGFWLGFRMDFGLIWLDLGLILILAFMY